MSFVPSGKSGDFFAIKSEGPLPPHLFPLFIFGTVFGSCDRKVRERGDFILLISRRASDFAAGSLDASKKICKSGRESRSADDEKLAADFLAFNQSLSFPGSSAKSHFFSLGFKAFLPAL